MSATTFASPTAPLQTRDIRSASLPFKRDRDHRTKWAQGARPGAGVRFQNITGEVVYQGDTTQEILQQGKVRPLNFRPYTGHKTNANRTAKPTYHSSVDVSDSANGRLQHKNDALIDANDHTNSPLSKSLLSLLPHHANNSSPSISTIHADLDAEILYSFDNKGPSPGQKANSVAFDALIEQAEQKWIAEQTEKIIRGEYEVLDAQGEKTILKKNGKRGSPKQKATKVILEDDDGFELI